MTETPGSANQPQDVQGDGPVSLEDRTTPGGQGSPGSNQARTEPTGPARSASRSIDDLNVGSADPQAPRHPAAAGSDPTTTTGPDTGPEQPVLDAGGTVHRAPGLQGQTPPGEAVESDLEGGAARMRRSALDTTGVGEGQGDASTVPTSGTVAGPGTSEELGVVRGVRLPDAAEVPQGD